MGKQFMVVTALCLLLCFLLVGCAAATTSASQSAAQSDESAQTGSSPQSSEEVATMLQMKIGEIPVNVEWEDNESVAALGRLCQSGPLTIRMSRYGGFEQVGPIGQSLPRNDSQMTTQPGDIVLYTGDQLVIFYGSNSWAYTKLGHIVDTSEQELVDLLGNGDVAVTIAKNE